MKSFKKTNHEKLQRELAKKEVLKYKSEQNDFRNTSK